MIVPLREIKHTPKENKEFRKENKENLRLRNLDFLCKPKAEIISGTLIVDVQSI